MISTTTIDWNTIKLIIMAMLGSFIGEYYRSSVKTHHESMNRCIASFLLVSLMSYIVALIANSIFMGDTVIVAIATLSAGVLGKEYTENLLRCFMYRSIFRDEKKKDKNTDIKRL